MLFRFLLIFVAVFGAQSAEARWREASSRHFVIYSEQNEADLRGFAENLERFDGLLRRQLRRTDPDASPSARLTIYLLRDIDALQDLLGSRSIAGVYLPRSSGSVAFSVARAPRVRTRAEEMRLLTPQKVLFHEYAHHFLYNNFAFGAPLWFSEGYPEFWSTVEFDDAGNVRFGIPAWHRGVELMLARPMHVREVLTVRHPVRDEETAAVIYGRGWLLTHYLHFAPDRRGQLDAYLLALRQGRSAEDAMSVFGDLEQLNTDVSRYLGAPQFSFATVPADQVQPGPISVRDLTPGEEAVMRVRMQSKRGVTSRQAAALIPEARRAAAPFPNDAVVQVTLAEAEFDAGNFAEAEAAADRAIAVNPQLVDAHLYKARALWERLKASREATPEQWQEVRRRIGVANRIDPDDPEPLVLFYESFGASGMRPTQNAIEGLFMAHRLAGEDRSVRVQTGRELLIAGRAADARAVLAPFTGDSHSGTLGELIAEVLAILDTGNTATALTRLDQGLARRAAAQGGRD